MIPFVVKFTLFLIIPFVVASILYPFFKNKKRSLYNLLGAVLGTSIVLLVAAGIYYFNTSQTPLSAFLGMFFGMAFLSSIFVFKDKWFSRTAKGDISFLGGIPKKDVRLRHVLQMAVLNEERGSNFYKRLAEKSINPKVKEICLSISRDEAVHKSIFEQILSRWLSVPMDMGTYNLYEKILKKSGMFFDEPLSASTEHEFIDFAIGFEDKTVEFYRSFERHFPQAWKKFEIHKIINEELKHKKNLKSILPTGS